MNNESIALSEKQTQWIMWVLLSLSPIIGMAVDLIAPSLPAMASGLHVPAYIVKNAITIYLLGYAVGNFVTGFLADAWGRKILLRISIVAFVLVSILPVIFANIDVLLLARLLQGIALGSVAVLIRTIFSDVFLPEKLIRLGVMIGTMFGIGPVIGPIIGGYLQFYFGWQAGFCFFAMVALICAMLIFFIIPETHSNRQPLNIKTIKSNIVEVLKHRFFMSLVILMGCAYSLLVIFNIMGPFLIQDTLHYSPIFYGHLAFGLGVIFLLSTLFCRFWLKWFSVKQIYFYVINTLMLIAIIILILSFSFPQNMLLITVLGAAMYFTCGIIFPMSMGKGISLFRHISGAASALMYFVNILITSLISFLIGFIHIQSVLPLVWLNFILLLICCGLYWGVVAKE